MSSNFPDYHNFPDRDKGEESFWPSFTDIMMVITMVFLLVTVMAITNNWKLVTDLQKSIQAQRLASEQALDTEAENSTLEDRMKLIEQRLVNAKLESANRLLTSEKLQAELDSVQAKVSEVESELAASTALLQKREVIITQRDEQLVNIKADRDKQLSTLAMRAAALAALQQTQESSQQQVVRLQEALLLKQGELQDVEVLLKQSQVLVGESADSKVQLSQALQKLASTEQLLLSSNEDKQRSDQALEASLARETQNEQQLRETLESQQLNEQQLTQMREEFETLQLAKQNEAESLAVLQEEVARLNALRNEDETKLLSLKGEFDSLDSKYQKLLRPARSSSGKVVVSVWFSKQGGRSTYKIREDASGEFRNLTRPEMAASLARLKDQHGKELYVKVIIPENSGLSYNDAWSFTTEMQRAYDYYYQDDEE